jgi:hypothetical protein
MKPSLTALHSYLVLRCEKCLPRLARIPLVRLAIPLSALSGPHWIAIVCPVCKRVQSYSLKTSEPGSSKAPALMEKVASDLKCSEVDCQHHVPLYALPVSLNPRRKAAELESWIWDDLTCPDGHRILNLGLRPSEPHVVT